MSRYQPFDTEIVRLKTNLQSMPVLKEHERMRIQAIDIVNTMQEVFEAKDADYAQNGKPLGNFRESEEVGVPSWKGVLVRLRDKKKRIGSFIDRQGDMKVADEKVWDTLCDQANYAILGMLLFMEVYPHEEEVHAAYRKIARISVLCRVLHDAQEGGENVEEWRTVPWSKIERAFEVIAAFARENP